MHVKLEHSDGWLLDKWSKIIDGINNPAAVPADMQERGKKIVTLIDNGMDLLRDPQCMPNLKINKLATLGWRLIGNRVTPCAIVEEMPFGHPNTLHFWCEIKPLASLAVVMVPWEWPKMCMEDRFMQLGGLVFVSSQISDYYHREMSPDSQKPMMMRAHAWEAEYLLTLQQHESKFPLTLNEYQKETLNRFPKGLESLPPEYRYELKPFKGNNDFQILESGVCVGGSNG